PVRRRFRACASVMGERAPLLPRHPPTGHAWGFRMTRDLRALAKSLSPGIPTVVIAGVSSGAGKTTLMLGLLESLRRRGLTVQPFKVGPDFIDPAFHGLASHRPAVNLDGWMSGREAVLDAVGRYAADADMVLVEGMIGC